MNVAHLISTIDSAFEGTPRSETSLRQFVLTDQHGMSREITDQEWENAGSRRCDSTWQDIPDAEIEECGVQLAHMEAAEFQYFLPAYMRYGLRDSQRSRTIGSIVFHVYPSRREVSARAYTLSQLSLLTRPQRSAIVDFLQFVAAHGDYSVRPDAAKALERFWTPQVVADGINTSVLIQP